MIENSSLYAHIRAFKNESIEIDALLSVKRESWYGSDISLSKLI